MNVTIEFRPSGTRRSVSVLGIGRKYVTLQVRHDAAGNDTLFSRETGREKGLEREGYWILPEDLVRLNILAEKHGGTWAPILRR